MNLGRIRLRSRPEIDGKLRWERMEE